jgi:hypothetical protein
MWGRILSYAYPMLHRALDGGPTKSEIVVLVPFDVTIGFKEQDSPGVDVFALTDVVEEWLSNAFSNSTIGEDFARFTTVILDNQDPRFLLEDPRKLQTTYVASYEGVTVWTKTGDLVVPDETIVATIQTQAFIEDNKLLLQALQSADASSGLGGVVTNVRASINTGADSTAADDDASLDIIIIIAIVIAALAFFLLAFALFMAWRQGKERRGPKPLGSPVGAGGTGDESDFGDSIPSRSKRASAAAMEATSPPKEIDPGLSGIYPESVISEDISTSLTAYYQSGMGGDRYRLGGNMGNNTLNDAASVSSMESYGYSLDGYATGIAPTNDKDELY